MDYQYKNLIRSNILLMKAYQSARSEFKGSASVFIDANENPYENNYNRYPDPLQLELKRLYASFRNFVPERIMIGNGSDEIIDLLIRMVCIPGQDSIYTVAPGFGMYKVAAALNDVRMEEYILDDDFTIDEDLFLANLPKNCKIIFLCSPNNPTGNSIPLDSLINILKRVNCLVVIDEAYIDFSDHISAVTLLDDYSQLVVLQTFSKALGSAGLRIGVAMAHSFLIDVLNKMKMPYNISKVNQELAIARLQNFNVIREEIIEIKKSRDTLRYALNKLQMVKRIYPSDANFLLVKFKDAEFVYWKLVKEGIVVRNRSGLVGCDNCLRISVGTSEENNLLIDTLTRLENITE